MYDFAYSRPGSVAEAVRALGADSDAKPLAGGQTLIPVLKQRLNRPSTVLDLSGLGLDGVRREGDRIVIGAMATHRDIAASPEVRQAIPGLAKMARLIGDTQVRHRGTIGGSLANNDPSACYPAAVLAGSSPPSVLPHPAVSSTAASGASSRWVRRTVTAATVTAVAVL